VAETCTNEGNERETGQQWLSPLQVSPLREPAASSKLNCVLLFAVREYWLIHSTHAWKLSSANVSFYCNHGVRSGSVFILNLAAWEVVVTWKMTFSKHQWFINWNILVWEIEFLKSFAQIWIYRKKFKCFFGPRKLLMGFIVSRMQQFTNYFHPVFCYNASKFGCWNYLFCGKVLENHSMMLKCHSQDCSQTSQHVPSEKKWQYAYRLLKMSRLKEGEVWNNCLNIVHCTVTAQ
jgi:hypothetical protein